MLRIFKFGPIVLGLALVTLPSMASPFGPPAPKKASKHHGHSRMIPARHNAGRPNHA